MHKSLVALAALTTLVCSAVQAQTANYAIDPTHTFATFEISHLGASVNRGRFDKKEGSVQLDKTAKTGKVELTIDIASITTGVEPFDKHLQSAEIFDAAKFPTAKFVGNKFTFEGDKVVSVAGDLTLKGKTLPVTFKANQFACYQNPMLKREVCGGDFETTIDRTQFGLDYGVPFGITKTVSIVAQIEAIKQ